MGSASSQAWLGETFFEMCSVKEFPDELQKFTFLISTFAIESLLASLVHLSRTQTYINALISRIFLQPQPKPHIPKQHSFSA